MKRHVMLAALLLGVELACGQSLIAERPYTPVVVKGQALKDFFEVPVGEIRLLAYEDGAWRAMPFQIDEYAKAVDPFRLPDTVWRWSHFYPDDGLLDDSDELVFMVRDLGGQAPLQSWPQDSDARQHDRLELKVADPRDGDKAAYAYLFRSATWTEPVPRPYDLSADTTAHRIQSAVYRVGIDPVSGVLRDIAVMPPWGSGVDVFDSQKMRFIGLIDLTILPISIGRADSANAANERDNLYVFPESDASRHWVRYSADPVVRVIREARQTIRFGKMILSALAFYVEAQFYPYGGQIIGGTSLDPESLKSFYGGSDDIYIELDLLRQSWDFSPEAVGMRFYNPHNDGVLIDGAPDAVDETLDIPVQTWGMTTGHQGTVYTHTAFADTGWRHIGLYYRDDASGGQSDPSWIDSEHGDTGDGASYGDYGTIFQNLSQRAVNLDLGFEAYFLEANRSQDEAEALTDAVEHPAVVSGTVQNPRSGVDDDDPASPKRFTLAPNYPNPFNGATRIAFELPFALRVRLEVFDVTGRLVAVLKEGLMEAGLHAVDWDGRLPSGQSAPSGLYLVRLAAPGLSACRKILLVQ